MQTLEPQELCRRLSDAGLCPLAFQTHHRCVGIRCVMYSMHWTYKSPRCIGASITLSLQAALGAMLSFRECNASIGLGFHVTAPTC